MRLSKRSKIFGLLGLVCGAGALACADGGNETSWDPQESGAILSPANDTRSNFILLMADRYGTKAADAAQMTKGIVPIDFPYDVMLGRLSPPVANAEAARAQASQAYEQEQARYGLSEGNSYFGYDSNNLGLCHTNRDGAEQFENALQADPSVPANEKSALAAAREVLAKACDKAADTRFTLDGVVSPNGRAYAHYLDGVRLFYAEDLPAAAQQFAAVATASSWPAETAAYMQFRTALAQATKASFGDWGDLAEVGKRDRAAIDHADAVRRQYLAAWPNGRYAVSARNFERRIAWLRGDRAALGAAYSSLLARKEAAGAEPDLATMTEIDRRILPSSDGAGVTDPTLLAITDLMRLRRTPDYDKERDCCGAMISRSELEGQRDHFRSEPRLFDYLLAAEAFYHRKQPREVLALIPDASHQSRFSYLEFSRQMLRGFALDAVHDPNARGFWLSLLPGAVQPYQRGAVELAIYQHDRASGTVGRLLETGSPILHPLIRSRIIEMDATPDVLRRTVTAGKTPHERATALYMLLGNELRYGMYNAFLADQVLTRTFPPSTAKPDNWSWSTEAYDPSYDDDNWPGLPPVEQFAIGAGATKACPTLRETVANLSANSTAVRPLLCLAEFIRANNFDNWDEHYAFNTGKFELNPRPAYGNRPITRATVYRMVMDNPAASADDRAFALNRAIRCYQPSGGNDCGGADVPLATRKAWYLRLKSQYPATRWAKELKYYW